MFRSRRGPVPSEAALRVLRQLAYISSGTACGAAALIAEERRRQISVASKIVDNSRRLKQHPRYHHTQVQAQIQSQQERPAGDVHADVDAFRSSILPSEVDKDYTKFSQHEAASPSGHAPNRSPSERDSHYTLPVRALPVHTSVKHNATTLHLDVINRLAAASTDTALSLSILRLVSHSCATDQLQYLCQHADTLLAKADPHDVETFYLALFLHADHHDTSVRESKALILIQLARHGRLSSSTAVFASIRKHQGGPEAFIQLDRCCQRLIVLGDHSVALDLLIALTAWSDPPNAAISVVSSRLFNAMLERYMSVECCRLLEWLDRRKMPCLSHLHDLMRSCALHHEDEVLVLLYRTYHKHRPIPQDVFPALCAAASKLDPSLSSSIFVRHIHVSNHISVLPVCEPAWSAILQRLWARSRNINLIDGTMRKIYRIAGPRQISLDVYNEMIHIYLDAGQVDKARDYLRKIQKSDHINPDIVTFGHFVLGAAKSSDWPAMDQLMTMLTRAGDQEAPPAKRTQLFVPALLEYTKVHSPEKIWDFVSRAFDTYGVEPDQSVSDVVVAAFIKAQRLDLVTPWIDYMRSYGLDGRPSPRSAYRLIRQFYFDSRPSHMVLMWLCRRLVKHAPENLSRSLVDLLREAVAYDLRSYQSSPKYMSQQARYRLRMLQTGGSKLLDPKYSFEFQKPELQKQLADLDNDCETSPWEFDRYVTSGAKQESDMLVSISLSNHQKAVEMYKKSLSESRLPRSSYSLEMAIHAKLKANGEDTKEIDELIHSAQDAGLNITAALLPSLLKQVRESTQNSPTHIDNLYRTVMSFYQKMLANNVPLRHHLATAAAEVLIENKKSEDAIRLLGGICHSKWAEQVPLDLPAMTTFLRAYIMARHREGIDWVVNQVLSEDYRIDRAFLLVLKNAHRYYRREVRRATDQSNPAADKSSALAEATLHWFSVCKRKQAEQKLKASRFGNNLVSLLIKMAKRPEEIEAPSDLSQVDPSLFWRGLRDKDGRRRRYRLSVYKNERSWKRLDHYIRKRHTKDNAALVTHKAVRRVRSRRGYDCGDEGDAASPPHETPATGIPPTEASDTPKPSQSSSFSPIVPDHRVTTVG